ILFQVTSFLLFCSLLLAKNQPDQLKEDLDRSKYSLLNVDRFLEIYNLNKRDRVKETFYGVFCRFEDYNGCRSHVDDYLKHYNREAARQEIEAGMGLTSTLSLHAYKDNSDCKEPTTGLYRLCGWDHTCKDAVHKLCDHLFIDHSDGTEYVKEYIMLRDETHWIVDGKH
ncbi:hypothetical protein PENTCL1PPCAC_24154, partial [Pristionchus entomophagus]